MMKLMTMKQYMKMSKPALIRKITKQLRAMTKGKAKLDYVIILQNQNYHDYLYQIDKV